MDTAIDSDGDCGRDDRNIEISEAIGGCRDLVLAGHIPDEGRSRAIWKRKHVDACACAFCFDLRVYATIMGVPVFRVLRCAGGRGACNEWHVSSEQLVGVT